MSLYLYSAYSTKGKKKKIIYIFLVHYLLNFKYNPIECNILVIW